MFGSMESNLLAAVARGAWDWGLATEVSENQERPSRKRLGCAFLWISPGSASVGPFLFLFF